MGATESLSLAITAQTTGTAEVDKSAAERRYNRTNELMRTLYGPGLKDDAARFKADEQI
jgi:hypothetical protein